MKAFFSIVIKLATLQDKVFNIKAFSIINKLIVEKIGDTKYNDLSN